MFSKKKVEKTQKPKNKFIIKWFTIFTMQIIFLPFLSLNGLMYQKKEEKYA